MKQIELNEMGVAELRSDETQYVNGGWWQAAIAVAGAAIYLYNEGHDFIAGLKEGYAAYEAQN